LPHLKKAYAKYETDPGVAFLLVSLDDDPKRLQRYLNEQRFPMPVARASKQHAQEAMSINDVPATFYVGRDGVVRYEARGVETHGDSAERVTWFIEMIRGPHEDDATAR
jgi:peroxiredoxin